MALNAGFYMQDSLAILSGYLLGSISAALWLGKWFYGKDIREHGSGNAGATNAFRVLGRVAGFIVLVTDTFKGWLAVEIAGAMAWLGWTEHIPGTAGYVNLQIALGAAAVLGHIFPLFAGFRGGKGIATLLGAGIGLHPAATLACATLFLAVLLTTRFVSLSSILASLAFPLFIILIARAPFISLKVFSLLIPVMVLYTHRKNIGRLIRRQEPKAKLFRRDSS